MTSRAIILNRIKQNKGLSQDLPSMPNFGIEELDCVSRFKEMALKAGSKILLEEEAQLGEALKVLFPKGDKIASTIESIPSDVDLNEISDPKALNDIDVAIVESPLGVAENGAIWLSEKETVHRVLPFITQHLVVVLQRENIVQNMHFAYEHIDWKNLGFGVFISGPSKTGDIEQSLVVGAQGARSHTIILI